MQYEKTGSSCTSYFSRKDTKIDHIFVQFLQTYVNIRNFNCSTNRLNSYYMWLIIKPKITKQNREWISWFYVWLCLYQNDSNWFDLLGKTNSNQKRNSPKNLRGNFHLNAIFLWEVRNPRINLQSARLIFGYTTL